MKQKKQFVLSASEFKSIEAAEKKVSDWHENGSLENTNVKLYSVVEIYDLKLKFIKRK